MVDCILEYHPTSWMLERKRYVSLKKKAKTINNAVLKININLQKKTIVPNQTIESELICHLKEHATLRQRFNCNSQYGVTVFLFTNCMKFFNDIDGLFSSLETILLDLRFLPDTLLHAIYENLRIFQFLG
jgi:hypothetical protein